MAIQTINVKNTYFGFTNNFSPLQKGKKEKSLDMLVRYDGNVMTEKEFIYIKLQEGYTPCYEENHQHYKRNGELTKPKTLYKLEKDNSYNEINKTLYDYANYLIENNFINPSIAADYIQKELQQVEEVARLEQEQVEKERLEREEKAKIQREKEEAERKEKIREWTEKGNSLMTNEINSLIENTIQNHFIKYEVEATEEEKESFTNEFKQSFTQKLGNQSYITHTLQYHVEEGHKRDYFHISSIEEEIFMSIFNIDMSDQNITITAKVKAFYNGKEYKGSKPKEQEEFYILNHDKQFEARTGERLKIKGITCFINKRDDNLYAITEARTGLLIGKPKKTKKEVIEASTKGIERTGERLEQLIQNSISKYGLSPLYREEQTA
jgi:hypothetical protein